MLDIQQFADNHRLHTRIDEDGTKIIPGKMGHIYEYDDERLGVIVVPKLPRVQYWGFAKRALLPLGFEIVQDGDGEGAAAFDPSNSAQVKAAIRAAKIKRKRNLSPEDSARRAERARSLSRRAGAEQNGDV